MEKLGNISPKGSRIIRICVEKSVYLSALSNPAEFKKMLNGEITEFPELFPAEILNGYSLSGKTQGSKKLEQHQFQRIKITSSGDNYRVYPSYVMPNLIAYTGEVEHALYLRKYNVPYSALVKVFGHDEMFWYRAEKSFSNCSVVGTTIKKKKSFRKTSLLMKSTLH